MSFVTSHLIRQEIEEKYNDSLMQLSKDDKYYEIKLSTFNTEKSESLEAADNFDKKTKRQKKKRTLYHYLELQEEAYKSNKIKHLIDFDEEHLSSVKSLAIKKEAKVNLTTRFLNGKILMYSKTSFQSFVFDLSDVFMFSDDIVKKIYEKYEIQKGFLSQNLTDADSTSLFFIFICKLLCSVNKRTARNIIFEVLTESKVLNRLDFSNELWEQFNVQNKSLKKQVGLYEVENISNINILTIAINPKEYFEKYKDFSINKKHKDLKKNKPGMDFEAYSERPATLREYCFENKPKKN